MSYFSFGIGVKDVSDKTSDETELSDDKTSDDDNAKDDKNEDKES